MTKKSSALLLSALALLPLLATTAEAGRRDIATRKTAVPVSPAVKQSLFDFSYWSRAISTQITVARTAKVSPKTKIVTPSPTPATPPQVAPPAADAAVAAIAAAPGDPPRRTKDGNPVIILLNPKAVISSF